MQKILATLILGTAAVACSMDVESDADIKATQLNGSCGEFKYELTATLAAQVGKELGRWEADRDFYIDRSDWSLKLTSEGRNRCAARGKTGCPGVSAILTLQHHGRDQVTRNFNPDDFRNFLIAMHERHMDWVRNNQMPLTQAVDLNYEAWTSGSCGPVHWYTVSGTTELHKVHYKLVSYGATPWDATASENPYLQFQVSNGRIGIDPTADYQDGESKTSSGSCSTSSAKIDCSGSVAGQCCTKTDGRVGTFKRSTYSNCIYVCG